MHETNSVSHLIFRRSHPSSHPFSVGTLRSIMRFASWPRSEVGSSIPGSPAIVVEQPACIITLCELERQYSKPESSEPRETV